jgi:pentatricopeptide repeat protein
MISAYAEYGHMKEALCLVDEMDTVILEANGIVFLTLLGACKNEKFLAHGRLIHAHIVACGLGADDSLGIALIDMYGKCKSLGDAWIIFNRVDQHSVVSWTAAITACIQNENFREALDMYRQMQLQGVEVDEVVLTSLLGACSGLGNLVEGRAIHKAIVAAGFACNMSLGNALINMYHKCGALEAAQAAFAKLDERNVVSWTTIISAYAHHGHGKQAVDLFRCMQSQRVDANDFTFVSLLSACNHAGLMEEAYFFFNAMRNQYKLDPTVEHYSCMIDLLGRAGRLEEAEALIRKLPITPDAPIWTSLISACKASGDAKRGQQAAVHTHLRPSSYVLLANVYAGCGNGD